MNMRVQGGGEGVRGSQETRNLTDMDQDDHHYQQSPKRVADDASEERAQREREFAGGDGV